MARRTELDPEMQNHFYDDGRLYHPLIIELRAGQVDAAEINELYRGKDGAARVDLKRPWAAIVKAAKLEGTRLHDLRHSFASIGAGASMGLPIIGRLLGHSQPQTTARYAHLQADPLRRAADTIGAAISAAMESGRSAKVPV
jgi:integrase